MMKKKIAEIEGGAWNHDVLVHQRNQSRPGNGVGQRETEYGRAKKRNR
jgi:hypothetical protein